jgi:hypothetical protein
MTDEEIRGLLREMREDSVPPDSLARVRVRVAERTAKQRWWKRAVWVLAPLCLSMVAVLFRSPAPTPRIELPAVVPVWVEPAVVQSRPRHIVRRRPKQPVLIRIETPDPEVVILLLGN